MLQIRRVLNDNDLKEQKYLFIHKHANIVPTYERFFEQIRSGSHHFRRSYNLVERTRDPRAVGGFQRIAMRLRAINSGPYIRIIFP